jgi:DUF4097 and DUF4098 domain-containing protein YvlB
LALSVVMMPLTVALAGCDMSLHNLTGRATDEWTHTYQLAPGGEVRIGNTNGKIEVEGVDGSTLEVRAERVARAATDDGARELLPRITIKEDVKPDRVAIETERMSGIMLGVGFEVRYYVRAPKNAIVDVSNTNGTVELHGLSGKVRAHTTNGVVTGKDLTGSVDARTTNGRVNIDLASLGSERISLRTTNGGVTLALPESAKADVSASWTNGGINISNVKMEVSERGRRRFEGKMNGGGTPIELSTTNGGIRIRNHGEAVDTNDDDKADRKPAEGDRKRDRRDGERR